MDPLTGKQLDVILHQWGITRGPDENDEHLRIRLHRTKFPLATNAHYLRLCLFLHRLNVKAARKDLPIGIA